MLDGFTITGGGASRSGGGIYCESSAPTITNCIITGNTAADDGGGVASSFSTANISNCSITENTAGDLGGGVYSRGKRLPLLQCTIVDNSADSFGGVFGGSADAVSLYSCIVWGNEGGSIGGEGTLIVSFSDIEGGYPGQSNINANPKLTDYRDYRYVLGGGSPCIDAGSGEIADGINWPSWYRNGRRSDIGAWGGSGAGGWLR